MPDTSQSEPTRVVVRPTAIRPWCYGIAGVVLAAMLTTAVILPSTNAGVSFGLRDQIGIGGLGVLLAYLLWTPTRMRVIADARGVKTRGMFGDDRFIPWDVVRAVDFRPKWRWARLTLPADETVSLYAVQRADGPRAVQAMRQLRALHAAAQQRRADA